MVDEDMLRDEKLREEFDATYSENDLLTEYCNLNQIILTPETADDYSEEDFKEFVEERFEEYKDLRLGR